MPIYAFICKECESHFSRIMKYSELETEKVECETCNSSNVERVITVPSNFYTISGNNSASTRPKSKPPSKG